MQQVTFHCQPSVVARAWILLLHFLFAVYFLTLPFIVIWRLGLVFICVALCVMAYRKCARSRSVELVFKYTRTGDWLYAVPPTTAVSQHDVERVLVRVSVILRTPWLIAVDIRGLSGQKIHRLLIWRDSLSASKWQLLNICLSY